MIQQAKKVVDLKLLWASPCGSGGKQSACNQGDPGSIPGSSALQADSLLFEP